MTCHQKVVLVDDAELPSNVDAGRYTARKVRTPATTTVAANGCESCHKPHTAAAAARMLKNVEEKTCDACHGPSGVASSNIAAEFSKIYRHPVYSITPSVHDASESPAAPRSSCRRFSAASARHAECDDCHNSHASHPAAATAPKASGRLAGVWGNRQQRLARRPERHAAVGPRVRKSASSVHADSATKAQPVGPDPPYANRQAVQFNKRLQFRSGQPFVPPGRSARPQHLCRRA